MLSTAAAGRLNRRPTQGPITVPLVTLVGVAVVPIGLALTIEQYSYDIWGAFVWGPVLLLLCVPICRAVARRTAEPDVSAFLMGAAILKVIVGPVVRYASAEAFYGGLADGARYDNVGTQLAVQFRQGDFSDLGNVSSTRFMEVLSGVVQAVIGDTRMGNFFAFSFFGFIGIVMFYLAFCEGLPNGDRRLYRFLLFLTPTMWYWPSSVGKEAVMLLVLGAATLGLVRMLLGRASGIIFAALGIWGTIVVRPHMALVLLIGFLFAIPRLRDSATEGRRQLLARAAPLLIVLTLPFVVGAVESFFGLDELDADSAEEVFADVALRTEQGGSEYEAGDPFSPMGLGIGIATVLARPFPWEANGLQGLVSAGEIGTLSVISVALAWRRRSHITRALRSRMTRLATGFVLAFGAAFATVGNFGILVRQRSLLLPFAFILVAALVPRASDRNEQAVL